MTTLDTPLAGSAPATDRRTGAPTPAGPRATPLWAVLGSTFVNSIGSGVMYAGVFFLAEKQYGFSQAQSLLLGLLYGLVYIPGALAVGPLLRRLERRGVSARAALGAILIGLAAMAFLPPAAAWLGGDGSTSWSLWLAIGIYSPLSGALWPIKESYLAGGRRGHELRRAIGKFNLSWSSAIVVTMLGISPFVERHSLEVFAVLGCLHLGALGFLAAFGRQPAAHAHEDHHVPPVYARLLLLLRFLLPMSFIVLSALSPYLPFALKKLGVEPAWKTAAAATWYAARVLTFWGMERWHGWHGKWSTPLVGAGILLLSFAGIVLAPAVLEGAVGLWAMFAALAGFGVGVGMIYCAALYYAMEVGSSGVDAGGMHETVIGIGYTVGPLCGLLALGAAPASEDGSAANVLTVVFVSVVSVGVCGFAVWRARTGRL